MRVLLRSTVAGLVMGALFGCGDTGGPSLRGPDFLSGSVNGGAFAADTVLATAYYRGGDSGTTLALAIALNHPDERRAISLVLARLPGTGRVPLGTLGDSAMTGAAAYYVSYDHGPFVDSTVGYQTFSRDPGVVHLTGHDPAAQLLAGTFAFTAYGDSAHPLARRVTGSFRLHYRGASGPLAHEVNARAGSALLR